MEARTGYKPDAETDAPRTTSFRYANVDPVPETVNWTSQGAVTEVKGLDTKCDSSWAFSAVGAVEGMHQIKNRTLISMSAQQLLDCDPRNSGCNGGVMGRAFEYIIRMGSITSESNYPYIGVQRHCNKEKESIPVASITGYENVPTRNETALMQAVENQPVSVAISVGGQEFQFYKSGIFTGPCDGQWDHGVLAVGYGKNEATGMKFWIVKNSWGTSWGDKGYILLQKDVAYESGLCGIAMDASYPMNEPFV